MTCPEPIDEHPEEARAARGCLVGLALCGLSALIVVALLAWTGWWLEALSLLGILLVVVALRSEREEELGGVTEGTRRRLS